MVCCVARSSRSLPLCMLNISMLERAVNTHLRNVGNAIYSPHNQTTRIAGGLTERSTLELYLDRESVRSLCWSSLWFPNSEIIILWHDISMALGENFQAFPTFPTILTFKGKPFPQRLSHRNYTHVRIHMVGFVVPTVKICAHIRF